MWYLIAMLEFTVLYAIIRWAVKGFAFQTQEVAVFIITFLLMGLGYSSIDFPRMLNRAFVLIGFYHYGFWAKNYAGVFAQKVTAVDLVSIALLIFGQMCDADWVDFSPMVIPSGLAGIWLVMRIASAIDMKFPKLRMRFSFIGQHTMFVLGTHLLWFKAAIWAYVKAYQLDISFLGTFGVPKEFPIIWKLLCFVAGLGIPIMLVYIKEWLIRDEETSYSGNSKL